MSQSTSSHEAGERSPVRHHSTRQMRAVRKELLLLRSEVERAEFMRSRVELSKSLGRFGWLKLFLPHFPKGSDKRTGTTLTNWINHPLVGTLVSLLVAKPLRSKIVAGTKPLMKWGTIGATAWAGYRLLARWLRSQRSASKA